MHSRFLQRLLLAGLVMLAPRVVAAQQHVNVPVQPANPEDVGSVDGIIRAFYDVISGPAGQPRQWGRDRTLYIPDVRFISIDAGRDGNTRANVLTHQQFVDASDPGLVKRGFYETEIHRVTRSFGQVTHVFSTYEMREKLDGPVIGRGVNSIQLFNDGTRWWIASAAWDEEREGNPIPKEMLP
jgi:hypothetical protein